MRREVPLSAAEGVSERQEVDDSVIVGCILDEERGVGSGSLVRDLKYVVRDPGPIENSLKSIHFIYSIPSITLPDIVLPGMALASL